jgi:hypothetical protein
MFISRRTHNSHGTALGMASPLIGIAGVNSLLFAAYGVSKRLISPFPQLSLKQTAAAGALAGAVNAVLASPGWWMLSCHPRGDSD